LGGLMRIVSVGHTYLFPKVGGYFYYFRFTCPFVRGLLPFHHCLTFRQIFGFTDTGVVVRERQYGTFALHRQHTIVGPVASFIDLIGKLFV
jgi:hypothetical protein